MASVSNRNVAELPYGGGSGNLTFPVNSAFLGSPKTELTPAYRLHWLARTRWAGLEGA
jgi:hypothetical protein